jgi:hypothetical protein
MMTKRAFSIPFAAALAALAMLAALAGSAAAEGRFFLRAGTGVSVPSLDGLEHELGTQGGERVEPGLSLGVSLGRSFADNAWSLELYMAAAFYREFIYENDHEGFAGKLRHFDYMGIMRRHWRTEAKWFRPSVGLGAGYGSTELISGGGKMGTMQGLCAVRVESALSENVCLALEGIYNAGLQTKTFAGPFLENVESDAVLTSAGDPLEDKYDSFDIRLGITVWLKKPVAY